MNVPVQLTKYCRAELHITIGFELQSGEKISKNCITNCDAIRKRVGLQHSDAVQGPKIFRSANHFLMQSKWQYK